MNWKVILLFTFIAALLGLASVFGFLKTGGEMIYWIVFILAAGFVIGKSANRAPFMHGVVTGLFAGILVSVIQAVMFNTYLENNPASLDGFKTIPLTMEPQYVLLFSGPFFGIAAGILIGLIAMILYKMKKA